MRTMVEWCSCLTRKAASYCVTEIWEDTIAACGKKQRWDVGVWREIRCLCTLPAVRKGAFHALCQDKGRLSEGTPLPCTISSRFKSRDNPSLSYSDDLASLPHILRLQREARASEQLEECFREKEVQRISFSLVLCAAVPQRRMPPEGL